MCADLSISSAAIDHLVCVTKQRAKGPLGRRLPRQRTAALTAEEIDDAGRHQRSESLPRIEPTERLDPDHQFNQAWYLNPQAALAEPEPTVAPPQQLPIPAARGATRGFFWKVFDCCVQ